ncbi:radical SAM protein [Streptomyces lavendulae]|uniref:radical SAM protein n=1 Tax=Streptomyces lavendulae TaxID=1914 RepID=UPI00367D2B3E
MSDTSFLWLEITGKCQLECVHCYAESGPRGTHGQMEQHDWERVIDEASGMGVQAVEFIGGEPTLHPEFIPLVTHARNRDLLVSVYTNLVHVTEAQWSLFADLDIRLATSYYSDDPGQHAEITRRPSHRHTKSNIEEALKREIPLRVGIVDLHDGQRVADARRELTDMGVTRMKVDRLRGVGRGGPQRSRDVSQLCGGCTRSRAAISSTGDVWPCIFSRWLSVGNVLRDPLPEILAGPVMNKTTAELNAHFASRRKNPTQGENNEQPVNH